MLVDITIDLQVDFMDMADGGRLLSRLVDARPGFTPEVGTYVVVGDDDAEPGVARVLAIDDAGLVDLEVLPGSVESHRDLLAPA